MHSPEMVFAAPRENARTYRWPAIWFALFGADIVFLLAYTWWFGAFLATMIWFAAIMAGLVLLPTSLIAALTLLRRRTWKMGVVLAVATLAVGAAGVASVSPIRKAAARRDIGAAGRRWAEDLLAMPRSEVLDPVGPDGLEPHVREALVPSFLKRGYFMGARVEPPYTSDGEPYVQIGYGGGRAGAWGYYLGSPTLNIPLGGNDGVQRIMPGIYSFRVSQ